MHTIIIDAGKTVICDMCNKDYSDSEAKGGILFGSKGVCPLCVPRMMPDIIAYNETQYIKAECPKDMSFKDWILTMR